MKNLSMLKNNGNWHESQKNFNNVISSYPPTYKVGKGPFCSASQDDCLPGYVFKNTTTAGCWTGVKGECVFSVAEYKKTNAFKELVERKGLKFAEDNIPSRFYVFGTAPICNASLKDVVKARKWPIGVIDGGCVTGEKIVAIDPVAGFQFDRLDELTDKFISENSLKTIEKTEMYKTGGKIADVVIKGETGVNFDIGEKAKDLTNLFK